MPALGKQLEPVLLHLWLGSAHTKILLSRLVKSLLFECLYSVTDSTVLVDVLSYCKSWSLLLLECKAETGSRNCAFCMGKLSNHLVQSSGRVGKNTPSAEADVMHRCCRGRGRRGGCQSSAPGRNAAPAPPRVHEGVNSWLWHLGNCASDWRGARTVPCSGWWARVYLQNLSVKVELV